LSIEARPILRKSTFEPDWLFNELQSINALRILKISSVLIYVPALITIVWFLKMAFSVLGWSAAKHQLYRFGWAMARRQLRFGASGYGTIHMGT
jgi:hypothetical protein